MVLPIWQLSISDCTYMAKRVHRRTLESREARINIRARLALRDALIDLAREDGRSLSAYVERILDDHVRMQAGRAGAPKRKT